MSRSSASICFEEAFQRLKEGATRVLPKGSAVSQNNVALEAGRHPSALRKERYPALVAQIQAHVEQLGAQTTSPTETKGDDQVGKLESTIALLKTKQELEASRVIALLVEVASLKRELSVLKAKNSAAVAHI